MLPTCMSMLSVLSYHKDRSMLHTNLGCDETEYDIQRRKRLHANFKKLHTKLMILTSPSLWVIRRPNNMCMHSCPSTYDERTTLDIIDMTMYMRYI